MEALTKYSSGTQESVLASASGRQVFVRSPQWSSLPGHLCVFWTGCCPSLVNSSSSFKAEIQAHFPDEVFPDSSRQTELHMAFSHCAVVSACSFPPRHWVVVTVTCWLSCFQGRARGVGRIMKVDWSEEWKEHSQPLFIWKDPLCRRLPCSWPEQRLFSLFKLVSWGITIYWLSIAENAITIESVMMPACEQAI